MEITIDFKDGAYLTVAESGLLCMYEDDKLELKGNLNDTLRNMPNEKRVEILEGVLGLRQTIGMNKGGNYYYENFRGTKTITGSGQT